jgi:hypothetical protein
VEEGMQGTACSLILSYFLGSKPVLEEGTIGVTELKYPAVFTVKYLIYIPNVVGSDFLSSASKQYFVLPVSVCQ